MYADIWRNIEGLWTFSSLVGKHSHGFILDLNISMESSISYEDHIFRLSQLQEVRQEVFAAYIQQR